MRLRKVEIFGFKSFRSKAGIAVGDGITAVVGPNGCGKSNIVDAVRWAMGTQSARSLRGSEMADVIFAGSRTRPAAGLAEVSLTFENDASHAVSDAELARSPIRAVVDGSATLTVTRRLYSKGDTDYLVNGVKVRLKDIQELFLGTGASVRGYSIIEQGQIDFLVNARPSERRGFVEELAGVTRYRYHRRETERKLQTTQANLERLADLLGEVKRRMGQLRRQAHQAERHAALAQQKRRLELSVLLAGYRRDAARRQEIAGARASCRERLSELVVSLSQLEATHGELAETLATCERRHDDCIKSVYKLRTQRDLLLQAVEHARQSQQRGREERSRLDTDVLEIEHEVVGLTRELDRLAQQRVEHAGAAPQTDQRLEREAEAAARAATAISNELAGIEARCRELTAKQAHGEALGHGRRDELARIEQRQAERTQRRQSLAASLSEAAARHIELEAGVQALAAKGDELAVSLQAAATAVETVEANVDARRRKLEENRDRTAQCRARRDAKAEQVAAEAGEGARRVLASAEAGELSGIKGLVGDGILAPPELDRAVHGVLRELLEYVVVVDASAAEAVVDFAQKAGLVVGCIEDRKSHIEAPPANSLSSRVEVADWIPAAVRRVLGGAVAVEQLTRPDPEAPGCLVDMQGNCANTQGFWRSGDPGGGAAARRARLLREVADLNVEVQALAEAHERDSAALDGLRAQLTTARATSQQLVGERDAQRDKRSAAERDLSRIGAEIEGRRAQLASLDEAATEDGERARELSAALAAADSESDALRVALTEVDASRQALLQVRSQRAAEQERAQLAWAEARAALQQHDAEARRLSEAQAQALATLERATQRRERLEARRGELDEQQERARLEAEENQRGATDAASRLAAAEADLERLDERLSGLRERSGNLTENLERQRAKRAELKADADRLALAAEAADRDTLRAEEALEQQFGLTLAQAELAVGDDHPPDNARDLLLQMARDLEQLGPINHAARVELEQATERHDFLCQQEADLLAAIDDMRLTIDELDHASRTEFRRTFVQLRAEFEQLFRRLFRGGEATLELSDDDDPLEAGVEVIVRPPGKNVRSMSLLSGGEKALTAVALVFAAFRLKPSPFCVLDEVDAPLDHSNVSRFVELIDELSDETQFLVITHNRHTMEGADTLIGVTMEEPGISKLVSVDLRRARRGPVAQPDSERAAS